MTAVRGSEPQEAPRERPGARAPSYRRYALGLAVALNVALVGLSAGALIQDRKQDEALAAVATRNLAQSLDATLSEMIGRSDQALLTVKEWYEAALAAGAVDEAAVEQLVDQQHRHLQNVDSLRIALATGEIRYGIGVRGSPGRTIADREYYLRHRDDPAAGLVVAEPVIGKISGKWVLILSRRLVRPDGGFAGVVYVGVLVESLTKLFGSLELGPSGVVALRDERARLVARYPETDPAGNPVGGRAVSPQLARLLGEGQTSATYVTGAGPDGIPRMFTFRRLAGAPLVLVVGLSRDAYLAPWRRSVGRIAVLLLLSFAGTGLALRGLRRASLGEDRAIQQLRAQEERYRIVADYTADWEYWLAPDGAFTYCSPSCLRLTGHPAAEFYADPDLLMRILHPDDREPFRAHRADVERTQTGGSLLLRVQHPDGRVRWTHHVCEPVVDGSGTYRGARGSNRDVTETKEQQDLVVTQKRALEATLARTRRLEGIISICMYCRRINCDNRSWEQMEKYISDHSDAEFSHAICPECYELHRDD